MDSLYTQLTSFENLYRAYVAARRGKRNGAEVAVSHLARSAHCGTM